MKDSFQVKSGLHSPKFCVQSSRYLQQWGLTFRFWEARKSNSSSLYCSGVSWIPLSSSSRGDAWFWGFSSIVSGITSMKLSTACLSFCLCVHIHLHLLHAILGKYSMILYSYFKHSSPPSLPHSRP